MSVDVQEILVSENKAPTSCLSDYPRYSLVSLLARIPRSLELAVVHVPIPGNNAHAEVQGHKSGAKARALQKAAIWVHQAS